MKVPTFHASKQIIVNLKPDSQLNLNHDVFAIAAARALFRLDCDLATAVEDALFAHGAVKLLLMLVMALLKVPLQMLQLRQQLDVVVRQFVGPYV